MAHTGVQAHVLAEQIIHVYPPPPINLGLNKKLQAFPNSWDYHYISGGKVHRR